ncbi:hypothetical protein Ait01nite_054510 [Actinoplanes italicus]|uniref:Leucine rich repeat (LRR) protein n=1 Tax=Actinoplanes italicus TaxID=113567 RepID=A0A2T0K7P0_9ACTN|nr:hypothetical protein [Actinoplanes italicus]PRX19015.1 hypothetical protein CLV67_111163 [Actinoplanes italicus]GIE32406.1 hypothetical protein Ait01nite_054510 [Actinoplanes italicus]
MRAALAEALYITAEQRAVLVEDPDLTVLRVLAEGPDYFFVWSFRPEPTPLPDWAYGRLYDRSPKLARQLTFNPFVPVELQQRLGVDTSAADEKPPVSRAEAEEQAASDNEWTRSCAAAEPALSAATVARLATDPSPQVRLAVSMRPELSEEQRAAIEYHVGPEDRITPARWAVETRDPGEQNRCARSAHIGLRRSVACNRDLSADLVALLAGDDDLAVRLLLCERHLDVPPDTVINTFLEATTMTRGRLLQHPSLLRGGLARLADHPDPQIRAVALRHPDATPELVERLSHDPESLVRDRTAEDPRLSLDRLLELFEDPATTGIAAANPNLPLPLMHRILDDATG